MSGSSNFIKDRSSWCLKKSMKIEVFSFFKIFSFKFLWVWPSKIRKIGFFVLSSTSMPIFISFEPRLLSQLSEKREKGEKTMKKECKTTCKTVEGCKTNSIDSWEDTCKTVEGDITNGFDSLGRLYTRFCSWETKIKLLRRFFYISLTGFGTQENSCFQ